MRNNSRIVTPRRTGSAPTVLCLAIATLLATGCSSDSDSASPEAPTTNVTDEAAVPTDAALPADDDVPTDDGATAPTPTGNAEGQTAADDYSPTATESASLAGPSTQDVARGAGPPSAPADITALMTSYDWVEFSWVPSVDDQSVEAYEIYRNSELIHTVSNGDEAEVTQWLTTSYMDCNYTKNAECVTTQPAAGSTNDYYVVAVDNQGLRSEPSETVALPLLPTTMDTLSTDGMELVFEDEFRGDRLDREKWRTSMAWGADTIVNAEMQYFVDIFQPDALDHDPFRFTGETLVIEGTPTPPELAAGAQNQPYLSGVISSLDRFAMTYGVLEGRIRVAGGTGFLSTFYLFNDDYERNKPEIDIIEYNGAEPTTANQTYHYYDSNKTRDYRGEKHSSPTMKVETENLSAGFHDYAVRWEPELVVWYLDGVEVQRIVGPRVSDEAMHIVSHLVVGSEWIGAPDANTSFPGELEIDYIRAWQ